MKSPRKAAAVLAVTAIAGAGLLTGCSASGDSGNADGTVAITIASLVPGSSADAFKAFNQRVKEFEKANPNDHREAGRVPVDRPDLLGPAGGGHPADVFNVPFTDSQSLANAGQLADITSDVKKLPYANKFNKSLLQVAENDKGDDLRHPVRPVRLRPVVQPRLFTKAGLDPTSRRPRWDEVRTDAKTISDKLGIAGFMVFTSGNTGGWGLTEQTYSRGGRMEVTDGTQDDGDRRQRRDRRGAEVPADHALDRQLAGQQLQPRLERA